MWKTNQRTSRRSFLKKSSVGAASLALVPTTAFADQNDWVGTSATYEIDVSINGEKTQQRRTRTIEATVIDKRRDVLSIETTEVADDDSPTTHRYRKKLFHVPVKSVMPKIRGTVESAGTGKSFVRGRDNPPR